MFREINNDSFGGELEEPIITIQSTPKAYGHVTTAKTWKRKDDWRHELNIDAGTLDRPIEEITATLIHEMTHLYNIAHNIQDCSRGGTYHNMKFKKEAEKHMLQVEKDDKYGWTVTSPTEELIDYIIGKGWCDINICRGFELGIAKPKTSSRKYVCPGCGCIIRATKEVRVICADCNELFKFES